LPGYLFPCPQPSKIKSITRLFMLQLITILAIEQRYLLHIYLIVEVKDC
jgi:hypothetical protein